LKHRLIAPLGIALLAACGAKENADPDYVAVPLTSSTIEAKAPPPEPTKKEGELSEDTQAQIKVALRRGGEKAAQCNKVTNSNVVGEGDVDVTVDGKIGKVIDAKVGAPFAGTTVEACIKRAFIDEYALTFEGQLNIPYKVTLEANKMAPDPNAKKGPKKK